MLVINLYGGPGTGKSTIAAGIFSALKLKGINVELVTEYAKDKVWDKHEAILDNQIYIFAKQYHRLHRLRDQVDVVITDSPILLSSIYNKDRTALGTKLDELVLEAYKSFDNINYFLTRIREYNPKGRVQTEDEAKEVDIKVKELLNNLNMIYESQKGSKEGMENIINEVLNYFLF